MLPCRTIGIALLLVFLAVPARAAVAPGAHTLVIEERGKGVAPVDGPWQFHLGDNPAFADPTFDDHSWEQITADSLGACKVTPITPGTPGIAAASRSHPRLEHRRTSTF
jgi:hypothetical protein